MNHQVLFIESNSWFKLLKNELINAFLAPVSDMIECKSEFSEIFHEVSLNLLE